MDVNENFSVSETSESYYILRGLIIQVYFTAQFFISLFVASRDFAVFLLENKTIAYISCQSLLP
jgi:hypothetical protein